MPEQTSSIMIRHIPRLKMAMQMTFDDDLIIIDDCFWIIIAGGTTDKSLAASYIFN